MPEIFRLEKLHFQLAVWKILEPEDYFLSHLELTESPYKGLIQRKQFLAARHLLNKLMQMPVSVLKDAYKKPFIPGDHRYISISHSHEMAAVIIADKACGIDIEKRHPKIKRIASKFLSSSDLMTLEGSEILNYLYKIWGAKEAMYKAYGLGRIDFKKDLYVHLPDVLDNKIDSAVRLTKEDVSMHFVMNSISLDQNEYELVYVLEK